jgi:hypothetical protein
MVTFQVIQEILEMAIFLAALKGGLLPQQN